MKVNEQNLCEESGLALTLGLERLAARCGCGAFELQAHIAQLDGLQLVDSTLAAHCVSLVRVLLCHELRRKRQCLAVVGERDLNVVSRARSR